MQDELRSAKTHDDGHPACSSLRQHRGGRGQCDVQKPQNGYGDGQKPKGALLPRSRGSSAKSECRKHKAQNSQGLEEKKAPILARDPRRWNQATGPISATICSVLEAGWKPSIRGFFQTPDASATLDGALFNKAQIIDSFSRDMEMQTWKRAAGHSLSSGMEKGTNTDFAKKARSQLIKEGNFMAARALDFPVCGAINEPHVLADGSVPKKILCVRCDQRTLATRPATA